MNAALLLEHYARIADAPDAIARLRRLVLDLAVRGKLVEQDAGDEPASELLKRIAVEKAGQKKGGEALALDQAQEINIPKGWELVPLGNVVVQHVGGGTPSKANSAYWDGDIRWASVKDVGKSKFLDDTIDRISPEGLANSSSNLIDPGHLIVVTRMGLGKVSINRISVAINQDLRALRFSLGADVDYAYNFFLTHAFEGTGLTVKGIKVEELLRFPFPLPPLVEQRRIVAKVDELMALCDQLEAARAERETARDTFALSTMARLNTPDPETFDQDARFALANLAPLTTRTDQIKQLRQTILNLAVRGKLVEQDAMDLAAEVLVQHMQRSIQEIAQSLRLKVPQLPPISADQAPFELPIGWCWARFPELGAFGRGRSKHRPRNDPALYADGDHRMIQTGDVARSKGLIQTHTAKYNDVGLAQSRLWPNGTLCITIAANIADSGILDFAACFPDSVVGFVAAPCFESARYFEYFMRTAKADLLAFAPATAQKNINLDILMQVMIPLPPLAEQHRIVAKVDELMALCDQLESSITTGKQTRSRLLEAVLHNALESA